MALKALVWFLLLGAATIATAISNVIPNVTSHITSSLVDKKSQHAVCSFHATYIQRCQNEGKGWHMMTYVNIPYIMDGKQDPLHYQSETPFNDIFTSQAIGSHLFSPLMATCTLASSTLAFGTRISS